MAALSPFRIVNDPGAAWSTPDSARAPELEHYEPLEVSAEDRERYVPHVISWNITKRCNLNCSHCYLDADFRAGKKTDELSTKDCFEIVDQIADVHSGALVILTGGEPLLRKDLFAIAGYATERGLLPVVGTNGTALTPEAIEKLKGAGVGGVAISLHARHPEPHDAFVGVPGAWEGAVRGADHLRETGLDFIVQTSVTTWNYDEIPEIVAFAHELGASFFNLYFLVCTGRGQGRTDVTAEQYETMLNALYDLQQQYRGRMLINAKCTPQYKRIVYEHDPQSPYLKTYSGGCPAATSYGQIDPKGNVTPCPYLPVSVGNLRERSFADLWWETPLMQELRDRSKLEGRCGACEFSGVCSGCRARAYAETNNWLAEDPSCVYQPGGFGGTPIELQPDETYGLPIVRELEWTSDAQARLGRIPGFVRGMVTRGVEAYAREKGYGQVTGELMQEVKEKVLSGGRSTVPLAFLKRQVERTEAASKGDPAGSDAPLTARRWRA